MKKEKDGGDVVEQDVAKIRTGGVKEAPRRTKIRRPTNPWSCGRVWERLFHRRERRRPKNGGGHGEGKERTDGRDDGHEVKTEAELDEDEEVLFGRMDRVRNELIRGTAQVGWCGDKVREDMWRRVGHLQRRDRGHLGRMMLGAAGRKDSEETWT